MNDNFSWDEFLNIIRSKLSSVSYDTWFKDTKISSITKDSISIEVLTNFHKDFLNKNYYELIDNIITSLTGKNYDINFVVEEDIINEDIVSIISELPIKTIVKQKIDDIMFSKEYTINKKRIEIKKLANGKNWIERKYVDLFLKLLEYIREM